MYFDELSFKVKKTKCERYFFLFMMFFFTNFMAFDGYKSPSPSIFFFFSLVSLVYLFNDRRYLRGSVFAKSILIVVVSMLFSVIPSVGIFGQQIHHAFFGASLFIFPTLLFFLLKKWNIDEDTVYKYLILFTALFAFFEVVQQFTYPKFWFTGRISDGASGKFEERMGFLRFYLFGIDYALLALMATFDRCLDKTKNFKIHCGFLLICCAAIYFFLARKNIYAALSCLSIGVIFAKGRAKLWVKMMVAAVFILGVIYLSNSMADLNTQTSSELSENREDFIRIMAADYFINSMSDSPLYYLFGSGVPGGKNPLQALITDLIDKHWFFQDDCGFVGYFSRFGIFGLAAQLATLFIIFRNYKKLDLGLILFAVLQIEICFFDYWGNNQRNLAAWGIYLYLAERNIQKHKFLQSKR